MRKFFSEYGWLTISGVIVCMIVTFTTPFGKAVTSSVKGFVNKLVYKSGQVVAYDNYTIISDANEEGLSKGDIITLNDVDMNNDGQPDKFRIIKKDGNECKIISMSFYGSGKMWMQQSEQTVTIGGRINQMYSGSFPDQKMNEYYTKLPDEIKTSLYQCNIYQSSYQYISNSYSESNPRGWKLANFNADSLWENTTSEDSRSQYNLVRKGEIEIGNRYVYLMDIDDIVQYLGNDLTPQKINLMLYNTQNSIDYYSREMFRTGVWGASYESYLTTPNSGGFQMLNNYAMGGGSHYRPCFEIKLASN